MARPVRYNMIGLLFCSSVVNYIDRVNISVAARVLFQRPARLCVGCGVVWYATDTPQEHPRISQAERDYIESNLSPKPSEPLPIRTLFRSWPLFTVCLSYMGYAYIGWMFLFWFPTYLVEGREMSLGTMGLMGVLLHGAGFLGILAGGAVSDWLLRTGWSAQFARARLAGFGVGGSLPFLLGAAVVPSTTLSILFLIVFYFFFASAAAGYTTVSIEFNPHFAGAIFGMINCLGSFAGIFGPMTAGFMLAGGGTWTLPFFVATGVGCVCTAILLVVPIRPIAFAGSAVPEGERQQAEA